MSIVNWLLSLPGAAAQGMIWGIMAIGVYITYKILDIADLTVDGTLCTGAAVCTVMMTSAHMPVWAAILFGVIAGMVAGLITGIFHTLMGIPAILAGILTQLILWSVNLKIMGKANIGLPARNYPVIVSLLNRPKSLIVLTIFIIALIGLLYAFFGTELGSSLRATGSNLNMSRAQGINTNFCKVLGLMISNGLVGLSGALLAQYQGFADINMGKGAIVIGLAAVIIGEAIFAKLAKGFVMKLLSVVVGAIIYFFVYQTVIFLGLDSDYLKMLSALVVAIFLATPYWKGIIKSRGKKETATNVEEDETDA